MILRTPRLVTALSLVAFVGCLPKKDTAPQGSTTASLIGSGDYEDVEAYLQSNAITAESNPALVQAINSIAVISDGCTGWLVSRKHLITNHHCVVNDFKVGHGEKVYDDYDQIICDQMTIKFNKQKNLAYAGYQRPPAQIFHCNRIVVANMAHDLAIIELKEEVPAELVPLRLAKTFTPSQQDIILIGQPGGLDKKISYRNKVDGAYTSCRARSAVFPNGSDGSDDPHAYERRKNPNSFVHDCDTIGGNSGSPVFDAATLEVVGLHWTGYAICKWPFFVQGGKLDNTNAKSGHGNHTVEGKAANEAADRVPYEQGNAAIDITRIREFLLAMPPGSAAGQLPEEIRAAFN